ncbi:LLM class flavin-dependent oxidoreductase [Nocardia takedensis]|uniref:LLM class flavin-dependent oxidoreductase n=1 Tax=Nocardia takedensis TaxID=259390 RepID=UPI0009FC3779
MPQDRLFLNVGVNSTGYHRNSWSAPGQRWDRFLSTEHYLAVTELAHRGTFDAIFLSDHPALQRAETSRPLHSLDPIVLFTALTARVPDIGVVITASSSYNSPYNLARRLASLDHLSGGRVIWNVVSSFNPDIAANFGAEPLPDRAARDRPRPRPGCRAVAARSGPDRRGQHRGGVARARTAQRPPRRGVAAARIRRGARSARRPGRRPHRRPVPGGSGPAAARRLRPVAARSGRHRADHAAAVGPSRGGRAPVGAGHARRGRRADPGLVARGRGRRLHRPAALAAGGSAGLRRRGDPAAARRGRFPVDLHRIHGARPLRTAARGGPSRALTRGTVGAHA